MKMIEDFDGLDQLFYVNSVRLTKLAIAAHIVNKCVDDVTINYWDCMYRGWYNWMGYD